MPPKKLATPPTRIAVWAADMVPELTMPPPALAEPNCVTLVTLMPMSRVAAIVPALVMPPKKLATPPTKIAVWSGRDRARIGDAAEKARDILDGDCCDGRDRTGIGDAAAGARRTELGTIGDPDAAVVGRGDRAGIADAAEKAGDMIDKDPCLNSRRDRAGIEDAAARARRAELRNIGDPDAAKERPGDRAGIADAAEKARDIIDKDCGAGRRDHAGIEDAAAGARRAELGNIGDFDADVADR